MALGKMLNLGGIDNSSPKSAQSPNRFRVARNVYPTPDGRIIPRYDFNADYTLPLGTAVVHDIAQYNSDSLYFTSYTSAPYANYYFRVVKNATTTIPHIVTLGESSMMYINEEYSQAITHIRRNNTLYFHEPYFGVLYKYDGVEMSPTGAPQPDIASSSYTSAGTKFLKVVTHTIDFDNNEPIGEDVTFPVLAATTNVNIAGASGGTNILTAAADFNGNGITVDNGYLGNGFKCTAVYNAGTDDFTVTITLGSFQGSVGSYLVTALSGGALVGSIVDPTNYVGMALKVKSITSPTIIVLDANNAYFRKKTREWELLDIDPIYGATTATNLVRCGRKFISIWASPTQDGIYNFQDFRFAPISSADSSTVFVANPPTIISGHESYISILGSQLNGIYAVEEAKKSFNVYSPEEVTKGMTLFQDNLIMFDAAGTLWYSDSSLGGVFEMSNGGNSLVIGDSGEGRVTSICGTQDFLFVSRERKNYYVVGNLKTGNLRVQEIIEAEIGSWANNTSITVKDSVVFLTALGVYQVSGGGKATHLSKYCPKNFSTYDGNNINEDVSFRLVGTNSALDGLTIGEGFSVAYDEYRGLLVFMRKIQDNPSLVLSTNTGEFYEWDGIYNWSSVQRGNTLAFIDGKYRIGGFVDYGEAELANSGVEDYTLLLSYPATNPIKLYSTWLTAGEPSLEKELLQLKIFGRIDSSTTNGLKVKHYKDWNIATAITDTTYFPLNTLTNISGQVQYSHKKRLNSDKVLAASVGIEINATDITFEIESMEVEFNPIQSGIKR